MSRPMVSAGPPAAKGAMNRMGLFGQPWAALHSHEIHRQSATKRALRANALTTSSSPARHMVASPHPFIPGARGTANGRPQAEARGPAKSSGGVQELGKMGAGRRNRDPQLRAARGHSLRGAPGEEGEGDLPRAEFR